MIDLRKQSARHGEAFLVAVMADWPVYLLVALYALGGWITVADLGGIPLGALPSYWRAWSTNYGILLPVIVIAAGGIHIVHRLDKRRGLAFRAMFAPPRVARFLAGILFLLTAGIIFMATFSSIKTAAPERLGFLYDVAQANLDQAIHFGTDPWHYLFAIADNPLVQRIVEINYNTLWFIICYGLLFWVATSHRAEKFRLRYLINFVLIWILVGNVLAIVFLSAGPAYYGLVTGDTARFGPQLELLGRTAGEFAAVKDFQAYLWQLYSSGHAGFGSGISAFPSMHVALISTNALFIGEFSRRAAIVLWIYAAFVIASSVYLGWHYAIDGYVSVIVATLLYWAIRVLYPRTVTAWQEFRAGRRPLGARA